MHFYSFLSRLIAKNPEPKLSAEFTRRFDVVGIFPTGKLRGGWREHWPMNYGDNSW